MTTVFFGTSEFAVPALEALHKAGFEISAVITMLDQPVGRKKILTPTPVKVAAEKLGLKVLQPLKLKDDVFFEEFLALGEPASGGQFQPPDFCVIAAYGKIIAERYINTPKYGFLNIHPSLLPKYRGPTPIQTAILNGEDTTGVSIIQIDKDVDHGGIFSKQELRITNYENYKKIYDKLAELGAKLLVETIPKIISGEIKPKEQDHSQAIFTKIFTREDARIDWSRPPQEIYNQIRALNPEPGTWTTWNDKVVNIKAASFAKTTEGHNKQLKLLIVQLEGKKETSMSDFLSGHPDFDVSQLK